jgi:hypothetical protein
VSPQKGVTLQNIWPTIHMHHHIVVFDNQQRNSKMTLSQHKQLTDDPQYIENFSQCNCTVHWLPSTLNCTRGLPRTLCCTCGLPSTLRCRRWLPSTFRCTCGDAQYIAIYTRVAQYIVLYSWVAQYIALYLWVAQYIAL